MKAKVERINLTYEVEFATPSFDLPIRNVNVLQAFYETLHPRFPIHAPDLHVSGGNLLSDVHVRLTLFNGSGTIDLSVERMSLAFHSVKTSGDMTICKDCIALSEEALQKSLPAVSPRIIAIKPTVFLELQGEEQSADNYLSRLPGSSIELDLRAFGSAIQYPGINLEVDNIEEKWNAVFHAFHDRTKRTLLTLFCSAVYRADGTVRGLEHRANHMERLLNAFLESIGLVTEELPK